MRHHFMACFDIGPGPKSYVRKYIFLLEFWNYNGHILMDDQNSSLKFSTPNLLSAAAYCGRLVFGVACLRSSGDASEYQGR